MNVKPLICLLKIHKWKYTYGKNEHYHGSGRFRFCDRCYTREEESVQHPHNTSLSWSNSDSTWLDVSLNQQQKRDKNLSIILKEE